MPYRIENGDLVEMTPEEVAAIEIQSPSVPDAPTLSDWRVALIQMGRFDAVHDAVAAARDSGNIQGKIAWERFEYANNVYRSELLQLAPLFGFSEAEIDQSLTIASQIAAQAKG